jgi:hypothetical protein
MWPAILTAFVVIYYRAVLKMFGYKIEILPVTPGGPEKIMKKWGVVSSVFFLLLIIMVYCTTNR